MSVKLPIGLGGLGTAGTASAAPGLRLPLRRRRTAPRLVAAPQSRERAALRAVAAAAALGDREFSMSIARLAAESPEKVVAPDLDEGALGAVLGEVSRVFGDRSLAPSADARHRATARAVGADPALVAAAHRLVAEDSERAIACASWVASVDAPRLELAVRAATRAVQLELVPSQVGRLTRLELSVAAAQEEISTLGSRVDALESPKASAARAGGGTRRRAKKRPTR